VELKNLIDEFNRIYGEGEYRKFFSPGRVNLIGEHIDYNGGYVFPCALEYGTYAIVRERQDNILNLASTNFDLRITSNIDDIKYLEEDDWGNYVKGIVKIMKDKGYKVGGMDVLVSGNIPNGAGLSSSASLELLIAVMVNEIFNKGEIDRVELVKIGQNCENDFVGVNCGIMDQFAIGMGKEKKGILLDCNTLEYKYADVNLKEYTLVIMNSNKRRALNESKYNERRAECEEALNILKEHKNIENLCDLSTKDFVELQHFIENETVRKRAKHAVFENGRVKESFDFLNKGKVKEFGELLTQSHNSLRDLYEVTGKELDTIVAESLKIESCIGSRMTGAGFGGCAIALVLTTEVEKFTDIVKKNYTELIGYCPDFYFSRIGEGSHEIA
jgi:galactokinase